MIAARSCGVSPATNATVAAYQRWYVPLRLTTGQSLPHMRRWAPKHSSRWSKYGRSVSMVTFGPASDSNPDSLQRTQLVVRSPDTLLNRAVEYAKVREQFGRAIGSFQSVKHLCAEMAAEIEPGRALVWYAGYSLDHGLPDASLASAHAKAYLAEAARFVSRAATEVHGGIGITDVLGLHYWFKRNAWGYQAFGSPERLREAAAGLQALVD